MGARWSWTLVLAMLLASSAGAETRDERLRACAGLGGKTPEARIKACSAAIAASAPVAGWLFGRDVAKTRLADIAAAERLEPDIAKQYARYGVRMRGCVGLGSHRCVLRLAAQARRLRMRKI
jgi:hypothetical protein